MNNVQRIVTALAITYFFAGCATNAPPAMTPLEIQSLQTREYEEPMDIVFPSVVSVFQDLGYSVENADIASGFITARSAAKSSEATKFWFGSTSVSQTKATGFIEAIGNVTRVRISFVGVQEESTAYGREDRKETPILAADAYQNAFERIENAIFVRSGT